MAVRVPLPFDLDLIWDFYGATIRTSRGVEWHCIHKVVASCAKGTKEGMGRVSVRVVSVWAGEWVDGRMGWDGMDEQETRAALRPSS